MIKLDDFDTLELKDRYNFVIQEYISLAAELAPMLRKFGKQREELQLLTVEFKKRGFVAENPEELVQLIEEEIKKENGTPPNTSA